MSPHALPLERYGSDGSAQTTSSTAQGTNGASHRQARDSHHKSLLARYSDDEIHDVICVGFGPASLAIAVALNDALEEHDPSLSTRKPRVRFLERQSNFAWHAGMLLPGAKMQITFIKDMATLRSPRSKFTFLNYLHENDRLVAFTNLSTFLPQRIEYEDYMRWCAGHFQDVVDYSQDVQNVDVGEIDADGQVAYWNVQSYDKSARKTISMKAKNVVIAVGGKPSIPKCIQANHPRVLHSSQYATQIGQLFPPGTAPKSVAVIGAGQSAAEIFHNIPSCFPDAKSYLIIKGAALRPSDDSPFVNEVFDPDRVDDVYSQEPQTRADGITLDKGTNYGVVRLELLEEIYASMYTQRIRHGDEANWPHQILNYRQVKGMTDMTSKKGAAIRLDVEDHSGEYRANKQSQSETLDVDLVIVASGYQRDVHEDMLRNVRHLMPQGGAESEKWSVSRDYDVRFKPDAVSEDAGLWLQGCNENTHGLSDTLLSILAVRGGEMVRNLFGSKDGVKVDEHKASNGSKVSNRQRDGSAQSEEGTHSPSSSSPVKSADEPSAMAMRPSSKNGVCSLMP